MSSNKLVCPITSRNVDSIAMTPNPDNILHFAPRESVIQAAFTLADKMGWQNVGMADIADKAHISLAELHNLFLDKYDILTAFTRMVDHKLLQNISSFDEESSVRDRLFELFMERFDILNDNRDGIIAIMDSMRFDPKQLMLGMPHLARSMSWMLEAARVDTSGWKGAIRIFGLLALYVEVAKVWREDESADLSKTMAELDKHLERVEDWAHRFL
jgi:AcrR family transcriptional regulator